MNRDDRLTGVQSVSRTFKRVLAATIAAFVLTGCASIWNASDLAVWVKDRAVKEGCQRETIELEEWYSKTEDGNVWHGTCRDERNNPMSFGINVDSVWKPSEESTVPSSPKK